MWQPRPTKWDKIRRASPWFNTMTLEARLRRHPVKNFMPTRNMEPIVQGWFEFRDIWKTKGPDPRYIWGPVIPMKVVAFGQQAETLYRCKKGDLLHIEGFMTGNKLPDLKTPCLCVMAKIVTVMKQYPVYRRIPPRDPETNKWIGMKTMRQMEQEKLAAKNLIREQEIERRFLPDEVPEIDTDGLDFSVDFRV